MRSTGALILALSWVAFAGSAQAQQGFGRGRGVPVARMSFAPAASIAVTRAVPQPTQNIPVQLSHLSLDMDLVHRRPQLAWDIQDAGYALWRSASGAMDDGDFAKAGQNFHSIHEKYPRSTYAAESWYWEAFSYYRIGGHQNFRRAIAHLDQQQSLYPRTPTAADGLVLATRLRGELAKVDDDARHELIALLESADPCTRSGVSVKIAALGAYRQINPQRTLNYLRDVFERPSSCSNYLRQQSVFILAQIQSPESADMLLNLAANSRDTDVRVEAVQWLADLHDGRAVEVLRDILVTQGSDRVKETALFALSQLATSSDAGTFRTVARSRYTPVKLRVQAVLWLAQQRMQVHSDWILTLYREDRNPVIREAVVSAIAGQANLADRGWLMSVGRDTTASLSIRRQAIAAAAEMMAPAADLFALYHQVEPLPLREQIIELLGRNREKSAVERLIDIAVQDADSTLRTSSVKWLRQSKDPRAVEFLIAYRER